MSDEKQNYKEASFDMLSVHERKDGKTYFHKLGSLYPHKDGEGHTIVPFSKPLDDNATVIIRTPFDRLEAKKQSKETQSQNQNSRDR